MPSETRAPLTTRERRSRLNASVPNGCIADGGAFLSPTMSICSLGGYFIRYGPTIATRMSSAMTASDQRAAWLLRSRLANDLDRGEMVVMLLWLFAHARIDRRVQKIGHEISHDDDHGADDHGGGDEIIVAAFDRARRESAEARPGEDALDEYRAAKKGRQQETEDRDHWRECVAQCVAPNQ